MKHTTKLKLTIVQNICDQYNKSTEFMIQAMQDICNIPLDCVMNFLENTDQKTKETYHKELLSLSQVVTDIENLINPINPKQ